MNKEITIYELLGLIKDDKVPKKIEYEGKIYIFSGDDYSVNDDLEEWLLSGYYLTTLLNEKVKILEEDKDIELLDVALLSQSDNWLWCPSKDDFEKDIELNSYIISNIRENTLNFQRKLNEVIKEVNKLRKDNNNG